MGRGLVGNLMPIAQTQTPGSYPSQTSRPGGANLPWPMCNPNPLLRDNARIRSQTSWRTLKEVWAWVPSRKLGFNWPSCELELAFLTPGELKIPT